MSRIGMGLLRAPSPSVTNVAQQPTGRFGLGGQTQPTVNPNVSIAQAIRSSISAQNNRLNPPKPPYVPFRPSVTRDTYTNYQGASYPAGFVPRTLPEGFTPRDSAPGSMPRVPTNTMRRF